MTEDDQPFYFSTRLEANETYRISLRDSGANSAGHVHAGGGPAAVNSIVVAPFGNHDSIVPLPDHQHTTLSDGIERYGHDHDGDGRFHFHVPDDIDIHVHPGEHHDHSKNVIVSNVQHRESGNNLPVEDSGFYQGIGRPGYWNGVSLHDWSEPTTTTYVFTAEKSGNHRIYVKGDHGPSDFLIKIKLMKDQPNTPSRESAVPFMARIHSRILLDYAAIGVGNIYPGDQDWWAVHLDGNKHYEINIRADERQQEWNVLQNPNIVGVAGRNGVVISGTANRGGRLADLKIPRGRGGTYYIGVNSRRSDGAGMYGLDIKEKDIPNSSSSDTELQVGDYFLSYKQKKNDSDWFKVRLTSGRKYRFSALGNYGDTWQRNWVRTILVANAVFDNRGRKLSSGYGYMSEDDPGYSIYHVTGLWSSLEFTPTTTAYYYFSVIQSPKNGSQMGAYNVRIEDITP